MSAPPVIEPVSTALLVKTKSLAPAPPRIEVGGSVNRNVESVDARAAIEGPEAGEIQGRGAVVIGRSAAVEGPRTDIPFARERLLPDPAISWLIPVKPPVTGPTVPARPVVLEPVSTADSVL